MRLLSIDIGSKNCAFYIEEFDHEKLTIDNLFTLGKRKYWALIDFSGDLWSNIVSYLDKNRHLFDRCNGIVIERQLKLNYSAQTIQHFIFSYFRVLYGPFKVITDISASRKTQVFGAPKMIKKERKKWTVTRTTEILTENNDIEGLAILLKKKSDDLADAYLQLKAFQKLIFLDKKSL